jgi:transcription-repair coupling factor (superfamily II helicase)
VDVFSFSNEQPFRITFFGNEIESIKKFDIETQLSKEKVEGFQLVSNMSASTSTTKVSVLNLLPNDSFILSKNLEFGAIKIKDFYKKAEEKFENLNKDIKHQKPAELFISPENSPGSETKSVG